MTTVQQVEVWWFDNHKKPKPSPWLQSTLSELKNKTKGMLKLIEGDADTFAQRAEMYCMKRPELVSMIEDFYQAYRSLAENYDHLKSMSSGCTFSSRAWFDKEWNSTDKSSNSSSVTSEVEDPESEDDQVESRSRGPEVPKKSAGDLAILTNKVGLIKGSSCKEDLPHLFIDAVDPILEVVYPKSKVAMIRSKLRDFLENLSGDDAIHQLTEETKHIDSEVSNIADESSVHSEIVHGEPDADSSSKNFLEEAAKSDHLSILIKEAGTITTQTKAKSTTEVSSEHSINPSEEESKAFDPELEEAQDESKLELVPEKNSGNDAIHPLTEEVKHVDSEVSNIADDSSVHSEIVHGEPDADSSSKNFLEEAAKSDQLSILIKEAGTIKTTKAKSTTDVSSDPYINSSEESKAYDPELGGAKDESKLKVVPEKKTDNDVAKLMCQVEILQEENATVMAELERKDEEKKEVIRQLSLSIDMLRQENVSMRKFIKEANSKSCVSGKKEFINHTKYKTTLVAI